MLSPRQQRDLATTTVSANHSHAVDDGYVSQEYNSGKDAFANDVMWQHNRKLNRSWEKCVQKLSQKLNSSLLTPCGMRAEQSGLSLIANKDDFKGLHFDQDSLFLALTVKIVQQNRARASNVYFFFSNHNFKP